MQIKPVTGHVYGHRKLEPEHPLGIKVAQSYQQTKGTTSISELIQHSAKLRR